jgi:hypothetical protein
MRAARYKVELFGPDAWGIIDTEIPTGGFCFSLDSKREAHSECARLNAEHRSLIERAETLRRQISAMEAKPYIAIGACVSAVEHLEMMMRDSAVYVALRQELQGIMRQLRR